MLYIYNLPYTQLLMTRTRLLFAISSLVSLNAFTQPPQQVVPDTNKIVAPADKTFNKVEIEASFPGGIEAWTQYLQKNLKANVPVKKKAPAGTYTVIVRFIVAKDGTISNVEAETNHGHGMEEEVMRIITKGPKWTPASQNGRPVNAYRKQPITFVVSGK